MENINRNHTFDRYPAGDCNETVLKVLIRAAEQPGREEHNPLFLYGPAGTGKTWLLHSAANHIQARHPGLNVVYLNAEEFVRVLIQAARLHQLNNIRKALRDGVDVLLMDDVQYLSGRELAQDMFFHLFDDLYAQGKQIILAANCRPEELRGLEDRVKCQFSGGILLGLERRES